MSPPPPSPASAVAALLSVLGAALLLLWPAALNTYPLTFGDTGVYLLDGVTAHASWPRPPFYGFLMAALHLKRTAWPVVAFQALAAATMLHLVIRCFIPGLSAWVLLPVAAVLACCTSLPWFAAQLMPDVFGGLAVLALALLILKPHRLHPLMQVLLVLFAAGCIVVHQSFLPTSLAAAAILLLARLWSRQRTGLPDLLRAAAPPVLALAAATMLNAAMMGQATPSPYGKIFVMSRVIYDGPGQRVLAAQCPRPDWSLCIAAQALPPEIEGFLFGDAGTISRAGGYKVVAAQAWPIVLAAWRAEPGTMLRNAALNTVRQFTAFATGDWLSRPSPKNDLTWPLVFPPAEVARYQQAPQQHQVELVPDGLQAVHLGVGSVALLVLLVGAVAGLARRDALGGLYAAILVALIANAFVAGALSGVYDRYQSRFVWLATFAALLMLLSWWRGLRRPAD